MELGIEEFLILAFAGALLGYSIYAMNSQYRFFSTDGNNVSAYYFTWKNKYSKKNSIKIQTNNSTARDVYRKI